MVAELHQRALSFLSDARLVGIFEPDEAKAAQRAEGWGCRVYATYQAVLDDPQVDGVFVLAPFEAHEELTLAALRAGKHVLVEKPAGSEVGIERMRAAAAEGGLVCMPGHNYAYQPEFQQVRRLVRDGSLGTVRAGWITYAIQHPEAVAASYGGVLQEVMIHHTYLGLALFGPPQRLYASRMEPQWQQLQQDDQAWMTWQYPGGRSLHLFASFAVGDDTADSWMFVLKMLGDKGGATYSWRSAIFRRPLGSLSVGIPAYEDSYVHEDAAFLAAMRGDANVVISPLEDALVASRVLRLAERAHTEMAAVTL